MLSVLAAGVLTRDPQSRTSTKGQPYVTALVRVPCEGEEAVLISLIAFNAEAVQALSALSRGDSVAVTGRAKLSTWTKDGEQRTGLSVTAEQVLTPQQTAKRTRRAAEVG